MRAILIDSEHEDIREVVIDQNQRVLDQWYDLLDCSLVETAVIINATDFILVDEEGSITQKDNYHFFSYEGAHQPFFWGKGLVVGGNEQGATIDCVSSVEDIKSKVRFVSEKEVLDYYYDARQQEERAYSKRSS